MVPAAVVDPVLADVVPLLEAGDIVIDGGNSYYHDDIKRAAELRPKGLHYVDVGVSGGVWGKERGYCHMIGGEDAVVQRLDPIFRALAPGVAAAPRTPGATGEPDQAEMGYLHCGPNGAGHFVKMVHNGIEYGLMAAYAEGMNILRHANVGLEKHEADAETTPLRRPELLSLRDRGRRRSPKSGGAAASSARGCSTSPRPRCASDPTLSKFAGRVSDSGEGRWTLHAAIDEGVPAPVLSAALFGRFESRGAAEYADKLMSAMRLEFGGHHEKPAGALNGRRTVRRPGLFRRDRRSRL